MIDKEKLLHYALENGIIDLSSIRDEVRMNEYKKYLAKHEYRIWQGKNGRWYTYLPNKKGGRKQVSKSDRGVLEDLIVEHYADMYHPTIESLFTKWVDKKLEYGDIVKSTHTRYCNTFKSYFDSIKTQRISSVTPMTIEDFLKETVSRNKITKKEYDRITLILNGIFDFARKERLTDMRMRDVLEDIKFSRNAFSKQKKQNDERIYSHDEEAKLRNYLYEHPDIVNLGLLLLFKTGLRVGELSVLTLKDINADSISINKTETQYYENGKLVIDVRDHPKTDAGVRDVVIDSECKNLLRKIRLMSPFGEYLFMRDGNRIKTDTFRRRLSNICKELEIKHKSPHKIRATYGTKLYDSDVPKSFICSQMGHTDISCLEKNYYFDRLDRDEKQQLINQIAGL